MRDSQVIEHLRWVSLLLELAGVSSFKVRAYRDAADILKRHAVLLDEHTEEKTLLVIKGIGTSVARTIVEFLRSGSSTIADSYQAQFSQGILEILRSVRGLGVKKLQAIIEKFHIEKLEDLLELCENAKLLEVKGFAKSSVEKLRQNLLFVQQNRGYLLYSQALRLAEIFSAKFRQRFPQAEIIAVGELRRKLERLAQIELLTDLPEAEFDKILAENAFAELFAQGQFWQKQENSYSQLFTNGSLLQIHISARESWIKNQFLLTGSAEFLSTLRQESKIDQILQQGGSFTCEVDLLTQAGSRYIEPELREFHSWEYLQTRAEKLIQANEIKGIIHCHTLFSDGVDSVETMALSARDAGFEYIAISDHSQSSSVANGMKISSIRRQHAEIDSLNQRLAPFKIFKSIECDILQDGTLDYPDEILAEFDFVIIAVHQQLDLPKLKATNRILRAVSNPYASILAHPTGRLLNTRAGYDLDFEAVFQACHEHQVAIELNTTAMRLDLDWRKIPQALATGCLFSINPDAHSLQGINTIFRGVEIARKAGLSAKENLSSYGLRDLEKWIINQKAKRNSLG